MNEGKTRVLMLGKGWFPDQLGGLDRFFRDLFEARGAGATKALVIGPAADRPPYVDAVSTHEAPLRRRIVRYWAVANRLASDSDLVDVHFALYAAALTVGGQARRIPWVVHFHGPWAGEAVAQGDRSRLSYAIRRAIERRVYRRADRILVLTSAFKQELVSRYRLQPWEVRVVPPGIKLDQFSPGDQAAARDRFEIGEDAFVAACVRRLVPRMGIEHLLRAWHIALESGLPADARLLIAGDGELRGQLESLIEELVLSDSVKLLGRISDDDLVSLYRAADVNVVPSVAQEGFGLIVLEAAACGTPTIVTSVGGLPEAVAGLDNSLVVAPGDGEALARRMLAAEGGAVPDRARTRAYAEGFSWKEMVDRRERVYQAVMNGDSDQRLRVVYLDHVAQLSGGELALLRLLPHMDEVNAHVILFEDGPLAGMLREAGISVEVVALDPRVGDMRKESVIPGGFSPRPAWEVLVHTVKLSRRLRQLKPDLVHANSLKAGVIGSLAARIARIPVVWHLRDRLADDYLPAPAAIATKWWIRTFSTRVIANSNHTADTLSGGKSSLLRAFTTSVPDVSVVPTAIPPFRSAWSTDPKREFTVGMVGRLAPWKGQDVFLRAFARAFPDGTERAVIVGSAMFGEDSYAESLYELVNDLGIEARVEWRGFVSDVPRELAGFDVMVHASRVPEPFGQVILEAFAAGVAVVAADAGGPREIVMNEEDGLLCTPGDVDAYARALCRLSDEPDFRDRLARNGRERSKEFGPSVVVPRVMEIYRDASRAAEISADNPR